MNVHEMTAPPRMPVVLARGAFGSLGKRGPYEEARLPGERLVLPAARVDSERLRAYIKVCGFPDGAGRPLPPSYPHILGFPLAMRLMADPGFPFPLLGLVHTGIELTQYRAMHIEDRPEITVYAEGLAGHRRGSQFAVVTEARLSGELVWSSRSTYLCRHGGGGPVPGRAERSETAEEAGAGDEGGPETPGGNPRGAGPAPVNGRPKNARPRDAERELLPTLAEWRLPGNLGRRYAAASGDRNPIHLHPLTARLFGFPRQIAHGMWSFARCLAQHGSTSTGTPTAKAERLAARAEFTSPVLLPRTVRYGESGTDFELRGASEASEGARLHLTGEVTSAPPSSDSPVPPSRSS